MKTLKEILTAVLLLLVSAAAFTIFLLCMEYVTFEVPEGIRYVKGFAGENAKMEMQRMAFFAMIGKFVGLFIAIIPGVCGMSILGCLIMDKLDGN